MAVLGIRGSSSATAASMTVRHAVVRTLAFPLSFLLLGLGFVGLVVGKERRACTTSSPTPPWSTTGTPASARWRLLSRQAAEA